MKLIIRVARNIALALIPVMGIWCALFYYAMRDEINDESDDALEDYSASVISKMLAGDPLPLEVQGDGSNNTYTIVPVSDEYAATHPHVTYSDARYYISKKHENEPARLYTRIFRDAEDNFYEIRVSMPTFEKDDLFKSILSWVVALYFLLLIIVVLISIFVVRRSLQPLYSLLEWLGNYSPTKQNPPVPDTTTILEFKKLNAAAQDAADRSVALYEQQKQFVGNASHELQTPLAVMGTRIEWLLDNTTLTDEQAAELMKIQNTLGKTVRLNKTLLLLSRIDSGQFPETEDVDIAALVDENLEILSEIHSHRGITCEVKEHSRLVVPMNHTLASILVSNLLKNAFVHSSDHSDIRVEMDEGVLRVSNPGNAPLDGEKLFDRFYQGSKKEESTGLGLAIVRSICANYGIRAEYSFAEMRHFFSVKW